MNSIKANVHAILTGDQTLIDMLALNPSPKAQNLAPAKENSVIDYIDASKLACPFITIRADDENLVGRTHMINAFVLVRCYNEKDKSFFTINEALSRVKQLINGERFAVDGYSTVEVEWETTSAELPDDAYDLYYREQRYRVTLT